MIRPGISPATHELVEASLEPPFVAEWRPWPEGVPEDLYTDPAWELVGVISHATGGAPLTDYCGHYNGSHGAIGSHTTGIFARLKPAV